MDGMNATKRSIRYTTYVVASIWSGALLLAGVRLPGWEAKILGSLPTVLLTLFAVFDAWLWRLGRVPSLISRPHLVGTWRGTLISHRPDASGQEVAHTPIDVVVVVRQTFLEVSIQVLTSQSRSRSIVSTIIKHHADDYTVHYHYMNEADLAWRDDSRPHVGGARLRIGTVTPSRFTGEYWTERRSRGEFEVELVTRDRHTDFKSAMAIPPSKAV